MSSNSQGHLMLLIYNWDHFVNVNKEKNTSTLDFSSHCQTLGQKSSSSNAKIGHQMSFSPQDVFTLRGRLSFVTVKQKDALKKMVQIKR